MLRSSSSGLYTRLPRNWTLNRQYVHFSDDAYLCDMRITSLQNPIADTAGEHADSQQKQVRVVSRALDIDNELMVRSRHLFE
jgi:hypothetical protein